MNPSNTDVMDAPLIALTNQCGGDLRKVLGAFFSFLHRRTDFYLVPNEQDLKEGRAKMGFPEGDAEKILLASFRQFPLRRLPKASSVKVPTASAAAASTPSTTAAVSKVSSSLSTRPAAAAAGDDPPPDKTSFEKGRDKEKEKCDDSVTKDPDAKLSATTTVSDIRRTQEGLQVPVGNGGTTGRYTWTQTIDECSVLVHVPAGTRGKDLDVTIKPDSLAVKLKNPAQPSTSDGALVEGSLVEMVQPSESTWTIEGGVLVIVLYKQKKTYWPTILQGDDRIDTSLVDSRRHMHEYDEVTQAQIRKIIFDQNQARQGKPSSDELSGNKPTVPETLPPGIEYINQEKIDRHHSEKQNKQQ